jgi:hypothetical protein
LFIVAVTCVGDATLGLLAPDFFAVVAVVAVVIVPLPIAAAVVGIAVPDVQ